MNRRNFLRGVVGGIAVAAAERTFPFRVYSFPAEIAKPVSGDWAKGNFLYTPHFLTPVGFSIAVEYTQLEELTSGEMRLIDGVSENT